MKIYNAFWIPGKVPSMNELVNFKASMSPMKNTWLVHKGKQVGTFRYNQYNKVKQDWKQKVVKVAKETGFAPVKACYFAYLVVEKTRKRDPSNIFSSAIKFIEDGLVTIGVIPNDGWSTVLGIRTHYLHAPKHSPGVFVVLSDCRVDESEIEELYVRSCN